MLVRSIIIPALALLVLSGCGERDQGDTAREAFDAIASDAVTLYTAIQPLRASRLGLQGADSKLFTYSDEEIARSVEALDTLLAAVAKLPADDLDAGRIDESILITDWVRGERFALTQSRTCLDNPCLYCWMICETVTEMPLRPWAPYEGEGEAWAERLRRLPALVENASSRLRMPGAVHLEEARSRLAALRQQLPRVALTAEERYGGPVGELDEARRAIGMLEDILDGYLSRRASERTITGQEEMSLILKYSEHLEFAGSTIAALARVEVGADEVEPIVVLERDAAEEIFRIVATDTAADRATHPGLPSAHVDTLVATCCIVLAFMRRLHHDLARLDSTPLPTA